MTYHLYLVTYTFSVPSDFADNRQKEQYIIVGGTKEEAREKADAAFMQTSYCRDLYVHQKDLKTIVRKMPNQKILLPSVSLAEDAQQFGICARLSSDGKSLEFLIQEK